MRKNARCFFIITIVLLHFVTSVYAAENGTETKRIALTFDDGPHSVYTPEILDILDEYGIRATFFAVGENVIRYPEITEREAKAGHEIENHTFNHNYLSKISIADAKKQITDNNRIIEKMIGRNPCYLRPPGGLYNEKIEAFANESNMNIVLWSIDTRDWSCPGVKYICNEIESNVKDGSIILMHDFVVGKSQTTEALRTVLPKLLKDGYTFVTVSELMS